MGPGGRISRDTDRKFASDEENGHIFQNIWKEGTVRILTDTPANKGINVKYSVN